MEETELVVAEPEPDVKEAELVVEGAELVVKDEVVGGAFTQRAPSFCEVGFPVATIDDAPLVTLNLYSVPDPLSEA